MTALRPFDYALVRLMPRVDRGEVVNVGVLLYCQDPETLICRTHLDGARLRAIAPDVDLDEVSAALDAMERTCAAPPAGTARDGGGLGARFRHLTAPRSTVLQTGPVHAGMTADPAAEAERLLDRLVR